ncbi:hypothetical protein NESM_000540900 [Novymonas esmeraldas]|uniref:Uncharacterized protein n=1 Tax=Novymonas esmeraldas TaxID=1808958 RepID=A0AAW0EPQ1_9TRYP
MLCVSSRSHAVNTSTSATPGAASPTSPSTTVTRDGKEGTVSYDRSSPRTTQAPEERSDGDDSQMTVGSTSTATPVGSGFFACLKRSLLHTQAPASHGPSALFAVDAAGTPPGRAAMTTDYGQLMGELLTWERELRQQLWRHEQLELAELVWSVEATLLPVVTALRDVNALTVAQAESVRRWGIWDAYLQFLLDVVQLQEVLHRRALSFAEEPRCRKHIQNTEVPNWIEARRLQVMRETHESAVAESEERARRLAYYVHLQQQLYQNFLLEEGERAARMEVERLQRLYAGGFAEVMAKEYRHVRLCQLRYEATRRELRPEVARDLVADEALHRSWLCRDQALGFKKMQAAEVCNYLASNRQEHVNRRVEEG